MNYYFELIRAFTSREIKRKYKASILGPMWVILHPLLLTLTTTLAFSLFLQVNTGTIPYPIFVLSGLIPWYFFSQSVSQASHSLIWNRDLITKVAFPKEVIPISYTLTKLIDFLVRAMLLAAFFVFFNVTINPKTVLVVIPIIAAQAIFTLGVTLLLAGLVVIYRDVSYTQELLLTVWFYLTPIVYPVELIPNHLKFLTLINPIANAIVIYRKVLFFNTLPSVLEVVSLLSLSLIMFLVGYIIFKKREHEYADLI